MPPTEPAEVPATFERVEEALIESEERYRPIVAAISEGIVMQDAFGRIIECNGAAERILGLTREQMMGLTSLDPRWQATDAHGALIPGEDHPIRVTLRTGEPQRNFVMGVQRPDGTRAWVRVNTQPLVRPGEVCPYCVVASFADISESRRAEAALQESEERFRSLYEQSIDGILLTAPDGRILAANPEACRLLGRSEQEICALGRDGVVDSSDPHLPALLEERARTGKVRGELTMIRGDGSRFPVDFSSAVFTDRDGRQRTSLSFRDALDRRRAEDALREANLQLEVRVAERTRQLATLLEIGRDIASELELRPLLAHILLELRAAIDYTGAAIGILENDEVVILDYAGPAPRDKVAGAHISLDCDSGYRRVIDQRGPVIVADIWADVGCAEAAWSSWDESIAPDMSYARSWLGVPLMAKGELIGLLRLDHAEPDYFTQEDAEQTLALAYQVAVAIVNARLHEAAQRAAAIAERERIARELHDSVSQALYGIVLGVHATSQRLDSDQEVIQANLDYLRSLAETGLAEMRALIFELRPDLPAVGGLVGALGRQAEMLRRRWGLDVETDFPAEPDLPTPAKEALYRIAQEATNNAGKHAHARHLAIRLLNDDSRFALEIVDDGRGFDVAQSFPGHMGLVSMQERATKIGAAWEIESERGCGTRVCVRLPLSQAD
jgi:PAS domain S-box-containing protein